MPGRSESSQLADTTLDPHWSHVGPSPWAARLNPEACPPAAGPGCSPAPTGLGQGLTRPSSARGPSPASRGQDWPGHCRPGRTSSSLPRGLAVGGGAATTVSADRGVTPRSHRRSHRRAPASGPGPRCGRHVPKRGPGLCGQHRAVVLWVSQRVTLFSPLRFSVLSKFCATNVIFFFRKKTNYNFPCRSVHQGKPVFHSSPQSGARERGQQGPPARGWALPWAEGRASGGGGPSASSRCHQPSVAALTLLSDGRTAGARV